MQGDCATLVHMEDGVVVRVEGNPDAPPNWGTLCPKGNAEIMGLYNPYRIKTPMIRTNPEKGLDVDPMWKEVTWDEALDYAADGLKKVREKDPRGLVICEGWGQRDTILREPFGQAFGTPNETGSHGALCTVHFPIRPGPLRAIRWPSWTWSIASTTSPWAAPWARISGSSRACAGLRRRLREA